MGNGGDGAAIRAPFSGAPSASSRGPGRAYRHEFGTVAGIGFCKLLKYWWPRAELNHRHTDFQSAALPTELLGRPELREGADYTKPALSEKKGRPKAPFFQLRRASCLHIHSAHAAHATHAAVVMAAAAAFLLFHQLRDHRVGGEHQAGYGRSVLQRKAHDLGGIDHAHVH